MMIPKKKWKTERIIDKKDLMAILDRVFSEYVRLRDSDKNGICRCITCGKPFHWRSGDAGHFISRDRLATRYTPENVNAQCAECNRFKSGRQYDHGIAIDKKYGKGTADNLANMSKVSHAILNETYFKVMIAKYRREVKVLMNMKLILEGKKE